MGSAASSTGQIRSGSTSRLLPAFLAGISILFAISCGGNSPSTPKLSGNTQVTVALSSAANDQLTQFDLQFQSIALTSQSGKTVTLLSSTQPVETIHLNGAINPLITTTVPQDVYTGATAVIGGAEFVCVAQIPSEGIGIATYSYGQTPTANVTVNMPSAITITGDTMTLSLQLLVSQSVTYSTCFDDNGIATYSITPTFNLTPAMISSQPTNTANGKLFGVEAAVASLNSTGNGFSITVPQGTYGTQPLTVNSSSATVFQGISNFSALSAGMFVNMDGALQPDGSLAATRIGVEDPTTLNMLTGPMLEVSNEVPVLMLYGRQEQGPLVTITGIGTGLYIPTPYINFSTSAFAISGQLTNLQSLPFVPSFNGSNMVPGQNVDVAAQAINLPGPQYTPANVITLIPQTINATIVQSATSGNFTDYTVSLAAYDLFPALAVQPGQATLLNNPSVVEVYVDNNTQKTNSQPLDAGNTLRFNGLIFNDNGTLRMDCAQISDGVSLTQQANASRRVPLAQGRVSQLRSGSVGELHVTSRTVTSH
jgi:Domain of unknown function (DUF5666)